MGAVLSRLAINIARTLDFMGIPPRLGYSKRFDTLRQIHSPTG
jgi:hypothetical protein